MEEKLIHFIWQNLLFEVQNLRGTENECIEIIRQGTLNPNSGPDFINARIRINQTLWAGNVEIHENSGDWQKHKHQSDQAYDSTILHVCWRSDISAFRSDQTKICCLILHDKVDNRLLHQYQLLMETTAEIPCQSHVGKVDGFTWAFWQERLLIERLETKTKNIYHDLEHTHFAWNEVFYQSIARSFGLKVNAQPFENLAKLLPLKILSKHQHNLRQIEALVFGVAGFLKKQNDDKYFKSLQHEYVFLKEKYRLAEMDSSQWKFLRLMPANFPTLRLAQFASLIHRSRQLFTQVIKSKTRNSVRDLFTCNASEFWNTHYGFFESSPVKLKTLGMQTIDILIINSVVPFKFAYGRHQGDEVLVKESMELLYQCKAEKNAIITHWKKLGAPAKNSGQSQALLQLKSEYCNRKNCLRCSIGFKILKNGPG